MSSKLRFCDNQRIGVGNTVSSVTFDAGLPLANLFDTRCSRVARPDSNTFTLTWDLGVNASTVDFFGLIGPSGSPFSISGAAVITLSANNLNDFSSPPLQKTVPVTDRGAKLFMLDEDTDYRFWQLSVNDATNPDPLDLGYMYLGDSQTITDRNTQSGFTRQIIDPSVVQTSENGTEYVTEFTPYIQFNSLAVPFLTAADRRQLERMYLKFQKGALFVSLDPAENVSEDLDELTDLMRFTEAPSFQHIRADIYTMQYGLKEVL